MHITLGAVVCFSAGAWSVLCAGNNFLESLSQYPDSRKRRAVKAKTPKLSVPEFNKLVAASAGADVVPQRTVLVTGVSFCENPIPGKMDPKDSCCISKYMSYDEDIEDSFTKLPVFIKDEKTSEKTPQIDSFFYPDDWDIVARSDRVTTEVIFPNNKVVTALIPKGSLFLEDGRPKIEAIDKYVFFGNPDDIQISVEKSIQESQYLRRKSQLQFVLGGLLIVSANILWRNKKK